MLRINLLPGYVSQRRLTRKLIVGFTALFIVCVAVPFLIYTNDIHQKQVIFDEMTAAEAGKAKTDALKAQATNTRSQIAPLQAKVDFVAAVRKHNEDIVKFWSTVAAYSGGSKVIYSDAVVSGTTLTIKAYSPSIAEIGRYLQAMYHEPDFKSVGIDKLPGYPDAVVTKYYLNNQVIAIGPTTGNSGGGGGAPTTGGTTPGTPAYGTAAPVGPASLNVPTVGGTTGTNGAPAPGAGTASALYTVLISSPAFARIYNANANPFEDPAQRQNRALHLLAQKVKTRQEPQGFPVTITATLNQALTPPPVPGAAPTTPPGG